MEAMNTIELTESERDALMALTKTRQTYPEGDYFEHDRTSVRMLGAREDVNLSIARDTIRSLGHRKLVRFTHERDGFGRGRWTFELTPRAADYV
jgi:hypothetical protein